MVETRTFVGICRGITIPGFLNGGAKWISQPSTVAAGSVEFGEGRVVVSSFLQLEGGVGRVCSCEMLGFKMIPWKDARAGSRDLMLIPCWQAPAVISCAVLS